MNNPSMYKDPSGHSWLGDLWDGIQKVVSDIYNGAKKAISTIYNGAKTVTKAIVNTVKKAADFVNKKIIQQAVKVVKNVVNSIISRSSNTIRKVADKVDQEKKKQESAKKKAAEQKKQKESFVEYAKNHGIDEAYRKYNSMDKSLLNEAVKAYCDTMDLDYISINYSLKRIIRSEDSEIVLVGKYKIICETIKHAGNVNESAVQSSVGYSCASTIHKTYISKAIELLNYVRTQACNFPGVRVNTASKINTIYNYSYGTKQLTEQYVTNMNEHSRDMMEYIWSHPREYKPVKIWRDTGTYSGGRWEDAVYHVGSKQYHAYGNWLYTTFVPWGAEIQEHAELLEFLTTIAGEANQSYNPYTGASTVTGKDSIKGPSSTNGGESTNHANSSIGNSSVGDIGNTTSSGGHGSTGNSTSKGYASSGNTSPGYAPPSSSNSGYQGAGESLNKNIRVEDLKLSETVKNHLNDTVSKNKVQIIGKDGEYITIQEAGDLTRPYINSNQTIQSIIDGGTPVKDTILNNGLKWNVPGTFRGITGTWELVVDMDSNTIVHFLFNGR